MNVYALLGFEFEGVGIVDFLLESLENLDF
jgi:hypothetical protein